MMRIFSVVILAISMLYVPSAAAAVDISGFEYFKSLHPPKSQEKQIGSFALDNQIFSAADNGYTNMRVLDQNNTEIPFLVKPDTAGKFIMKEYKNAMKKVSFELLPDNHIEIIFKRKDSSFSPATIEFVTKQRNFDKQVTISGSNDRSKWNVMVANYPIFDYSRYFDTRNIRVEFTPGNFDFYKIEIWNISETHQSPLTRIIRETKSEVLVQKTEKVSFQKKDFKIDKIKFLAKKKIFVENKRITRSYTAEDIHTVHNADTKETEIVFRTDRQPLISMKIMAEDSNYSRPVTIEGADDTGKERQWRHIKSTNISRVKTGRFCREQTIVNLESLCRFALYRIIIKNFDNPALNISDIKLNGEVHKLLFFSKQGKNYRLLYGGRTSPNPRYDIGEVIRNLKNVDTDVYSVGQQERNSLFSASKKKQIFDGRKLFIAAIILMTVVLSWILVIVSKKVERETTE